VIIEGPVCTNISTFAISWHYNGTDYSVVTNDRLSFGCAECCPNLVGTLVQVEFVPGDPSQFLWAWATGEWEYFTGYLVALILFFLLALVALGCVIDECLEQRKTARERQNLCETE
jgi:hypothetical protein